MPAALNAEGRKTAREWVWEKFGYRTYEPAVDRFHASTARTRIISCPARTSKSYAGAWDIIPDVALHGVTLALDPDNTETQRGWIVAPNYELAKEFDYFWTAFVELGEKLDLGYKLGRHKNNPKQGDMEIELLWGKNTRGEVVRSLIEVRTSANEKSLQSEQLDWVIMSEAARHPEIVWSKYLRTRTGRSVWPTTPDLQAAWIYELIENSKEYPELNIEHFEFTGRANPNYDWENYWTEHQKAELQIAGEISVVPGDMTSCPSTANGHDCFDDTVGCIAMKEDGFAEQMGGKWVFHKGRIVPLREKVGENGQPAHVIREDRTWFPHADLHISFDYGYSDGTCIGFWLVGAQQIVLRKSIYERGLVPDDIVRLVMDMKSWFNRAYGIDSVKRLVGDPKKPEVAELFRRRGLPIFDIDKSAQVDRKAGHMELMNYLKTDIATGEPGMLVHADNVEVIKEWKKLRRNERVRLEDSQSAFIGDDHAYDMARYFVMTRPVRNGVKLTNQISDFERYRRKNVALATNRQKATVRSAYGKRRTGGLLVGA